MRLVPVLAWSLVDGDHEPLNDRLLPLLNALERTPSLTDAITEVGISYRAAWGMLRDYRLKLGEPLVEMTRGRGTKLTAAGQQFLDAQRKAAQALAPVLPTLGIELVTEPPSE